MNTPLLKQLWTVSAVLINMFAQGTVLGFPSSLVPGLLDPKSSIKTDLNTASWLASVIGPTYIVGSLISSILMNFFGRKWTHIICTVPGLFGWVLIYYATNIPMLMCGRILGGTVTGSAVSLGAIVIGEYTSPHYRGMFLNLKTAGVCCGAMFVHILSFYLSWREIALFATAPYVASLLITLTWPESPFWLASKQKYEQSERSFYWLRGNNASSRKEIEKIIDAQTKRPTSEYDCTLRSKVVEVIKKFTRKDFLKPVGIAVTSSVLLEASGRHVFPTYAVQIIGEVTGEEYLSIYYILGLDILITLSATSSSILVRMMKRRTLLFSTGIASLAVLAIACLYVYLTSIDIISKERPWVSISLFVIYFILANLGCTPLPLALLGEIFPLAHRGVGSAVSGLSLSLCLMIALQSAPYMLVTIKVHNMFAVYGLVIALCLTILYFTLPETKDLTLQEIEYFFNYGQYEKVQLADEEVRDKMIDVE